MLIKPFYKTNSQDKELVIRDHELDEILLVRRKTMPYEGFWALPGKFFKPSDDVVAEETASEAVSDELDIPVEFRMENQFRTYSNFVIDPQNVVVDVVYAMENQSWFPGRNMEWGWFKMNELPRMAFNHRQIIEDYLGAQKTN